MSLASASLLHPVSFLLSHDLQQAIPIAYLHILATHRPCTRAFLCCASV